MATAKGNSEKDGKSGRKKVFVGVLYGEDDGESFTNGSDGFIGGEWTDLPQAAAAILEGLAARDLGDGMNKFSKAVAALGLNAALMQDPQTKTALEANEQLRDLMQI